MIMQASCGADRGAASQKSPGVFHALEKRAREFSYRESKPTDHLGGCNPAGRTFLLTLSRHLEKEKQPERGARLDEMEIWIG